MAARKTLIVVGAGASKEANLPTGAELKQKIADMLNIQFDTQGNPTRVDSILFDALRDLLVREYLNLDIIPYLKAAHKIRDAMPLAESIDSFIDAHKGDKQIERCGKLAIVRSILGAERHSLLYGERLKLDRIDNTWYINFFRLLTENCPDDELEDRLSLISLVIFNYDRCIEHFLYHSLQMYYRMTAERAAELVRSISIYHPYGTVGALPWYGGDAVSEFGMEPHPSLLVDLANQIRTFTEGTDPGVSDIVAIRRDVEIAQVALFLGFAFHRLNMALMQPEYPNKKQRIVRIFATAKSFSDSDCKGISIDVQNLFKAAPNPIYIRNDLTCVRLFEEYRRSLSLLNGSKP